MGVRAPREPRGEAVIHAPLLHGRLSLVRYRRLVIRVYAHEARWSRGRSSAGGDRGVGGGRGAGGRRGAGGGRGAGVATSTMGALAVNGTDLGARGLAPRI